MLSWNCLWYLLLEAATGALVGQASSVVEDDFTKKPIKKAATIKTITTMITSAILAFRRRGSLGFISSRLYSMFDGNESIARFSCAIKRKILDWQN